MSKEQAGGESTRVVVAALAANLGIAAAKFVAAALSGSSAMLTEGIHSTVDSVNEALLLWGEHRSRRPPDEAHPFGYARELYFWSFIVALLIFSIGAGVSVYEGWAHIVHPAPLESATLNYAVLGVSAALEGSSWLVAVRSFGRQKGDAGWWAAIRESKDPATFIVMFEDSAALIGLLIAAIGVGLSHALGDPRIDGGASILIGVTLGLVAVLLAREAKGLLIGERADKAVVDRIRATLSGFPEIRHVNHVRTIHTGPSTIFAAVSADFNDELRMGDAERLVERMEAALKAAEPTLASIYIRPEQAEGAVVLPQERARPALA